jgi:hypothetical protein
MLSLDRTLEVNPDVVDAELDPQETALLHLGTRVYFTLNATGTHIWLRIKEGLTLDAISASLQSEFGLEPEHANTSVLGFARELHENGLVGIAS